MYFYDKNYYQAQPGYLSSPTLNPLLTINAPKPAVTRAALIQKITTFLNKFHTNLHNILYNNDPEKTKVWVDLANDLITNDLASIPLQLV
ncbi:MAG: hypothetical protein RLZ12_534 [Bacillota bacterium]